MSYNKPFSTAEFERRVQSVKQRMDAKSAHITTDLPDENIVSFSEPLVHHSVDHPFDELCNLIKARGWACARIGVELDAHYYTARAHQHLINGLPNATIADNHEIVNWARLVKSAAELVYMREAGQVATATINTAIERLKPGVRQFEIIADVYHSQTTGLNNKFGDYTGLCPLIQVDGGTSTPHLTWTDEPIPDHGLIMMEIGAARRHYNVPLTHTMHMGKPPAAITRLAQVIVEGGDAALGAAKPGASCEEVEAGWCYLWSKSVGR